MLDITPLPSPIVLGGCWDKMAPAAYPDPPTELSPPRSAALAANGEAVSSALQVPQKRKSYAGLGPNQSAGPLPQPSATKSENAAAFTRNRDVSEYLPDRAPTGKPRQITVSESGGPRTMQISLPAADPTLKREQYLAVERGLATPVVIPPTPPPENIGQDGEADDPRLKLDPSHRRQQSLSQPEVYEAEGVRDHQRKKWIEVCELGTGTFSRVVLATSDNAVKHRPIGGSIPDRKSLVAVKIVQHGPAGGASEERIETSLKREIEILKAIHHPSVVHLKAVGTEPSRTLLVLGYCPGGDLYGVASERHQLLTPSLIQRIFAELVAATRYLHEHLIVHRDIKLESMYPACDPSLADN
jgi:protein-serine/threonine kinase